MKNILLILVVIYCLLAYSLTAFSEETGEAAAQDNIEQEENLQKLQAIFEQEMLAKQNLSFDRVSIEYIQGGYSSSSVYRANTISSNGNGSYVIKWFAEKEGEMDRELVLSSFVAKHNIGPKVFAASRENRVLISEDLGSEIVTELNDEQVENLAKHLKSLHTDLGVGLALAPNFAPKAKDGSKKQFDFSALTKPLSVKQYIEVVVRSYKRELPDKFDQVYALVKRDIKTLDDSKLGAFCHLDLNQGNIIPKKTLNGDEVRIIDWIDSRFSNPMLDIATIFYFYNMDDAKKKRFIDIYSSDSPSSSISKPVIAEYMDAALRVVKFRYSIELLKISKRDKSGMTLSDDTKKYLENLIEENNWKEIMPIVIKPGHARYLAELIVESAGS